MLTNRIFKTALAAVGVLAAVAVITHALTGKVLLLF
jgi:hypothetical protein